MIDSTAMGSFFEYLRLSEKSVKTLIFMKNPVFRQKPQNRGFGSKLADLAEKPGFGGVALLIKDYFLVQMVEILNH